MIPLEETLNQEYKKISRKDVREEKAKVLYDEIYKRDPELMDDMDYYWKEQFLKIYVPLSIIKTISGLTIMYGVSFLKEFYVIGDCVIALNRDVFSFMGLGITLTGFTDILIVGLAHKYADSRKMKKEDEFILDYVIEKGLENKK